MDPLACLIRVDQAVSDLNWAEVIDGLNDYYQWRLRGGVEPRGFDSIRGITTGDALADRLSTTAANNS